MSPTISTDKTLLNIDFIYGFLSQSYWANDRSKEKIIESIQHSLCFGLYLDHQQIGFARVLTDKVVFSYIIDVFIDPNHQGKEYGQFFFKEIYKHPDLINVKAHYLLTKDAQEFYKKFGFFIYPEPEKFMVKRDA